MIRYTLDILRLLWLFVCWIGLVCVIGIGSIFYLLGFGFASLFQGDR